MQPAKQPKSARTCFLSIMIFFLVCGFGSWGIRELLFPPTDVCAIERSEGRKLLDISQVHPIKNNIELIGHVGGKAQSVFVRGDIAFVKLGLEVAAFDVRDPAHLRRIGYILIPGELVYVDDRRNYAYIHSTGGSSGLWKIDVSNPIQMSAIHIYDSKFPIVSIRFVDEQAYVTTRTCEYTYFLEGSFKTRCDDTLHIVDTNDLDSPVQCYQGLLGNAARTLAVSSMPERITAPQIAIQGNYSYHAEGKDGLKVYDVSNPLQLAEIGSYSSTAEFTDVVVYKAHAFATSLECKNQEIYYCLNALDVADPIDPKDLGELPHKPVIVTEFDHYAVLREQFGYGNWPPGVEIFDMSLPNPEGATIAPAQIADIVNMIVSDKRAYATTRDNRFLILDISTVENPVTIASYNLGGQDQLNYGISVVHNYAYIIVRDIGLRILDISDETTIREAGKYRMESIPVELTAKDQYVYIAEWYGTLEIVNVSDPMRPIRVGVYDAKGRINGMHIVNNYLFVTAGSSGLQVLDISDPAFPSLVSSFTSGTFMTGVDVNCQHIYISDIENGLFILQSDLLPTDKCD